jgi:hypothetical protein
MSKTVDRIVCFAEQLRELEDEWINIKEQVDGCIAQMKLELDTIVKRRMISVWGILESHKRKNSLEISLILLAR